MLFGSSTNLRFMSVFTWMTLLAASSVLCARGGAAGFQLADRTGDVSILYTVVIDNESAPKHMAHVRLRMDALTGPSVTLAFDKQGGLLGGPHPISVRNLSATNERGERLQTTQYSEGGWPSWVVSAYNTKILTIEYDVILGYYWKAIDAYVGYIGRDFGMSMGLWTFLVPNGFSKSPVLANFSLPAGWGVYAPWEKEGDLWYAPTLEYFSTSTFALGAFRVLTRRVSSTDVSIVVYDRWEQPLQQQIADACFRIFEYYAATVFRMSPLERYMAIWAPTTHDEKTVGQCEWSHSQGISLWQRRFHAGHMQEYAHRVFHIWNVFPPTGMQAGTRENDWTWWAAEGIAIYYNTRALVDLGYLKGNELLREDLNRYLQGVLGTKNDAPVAEAFKLWDVSTDAYFFVTYRKGALVSFLMDALTRKLTGEDKTLDDVMRGLYERYGNMRASYSNRDIARIISSMAGFDFDPFFARYVYGKDKLPLQVIPGDLTVDWFELLQSLKLSRIPLITLRVSPTLGKVGETVTFTARLVSIDNRPIMNQTINFYLDSTLVGSTTTDESGLATLIFKIMVNPGTFTVTAHYAGSTIFLQSKETAMLNVLAVNTSLALSAPSTVATGKPILIGAVLKDEQSIPIMDATIDFYIDLGGAWSKIGSVKTNTQGVASVNYTFDRVGVFSVRATYTGGGGYGGSDKSMMVTVTAPKEETAISKLPDYVPLAVICLVAVLAVAILAKKRSRKEQLETT